MMKRIQRPTLLCLLIVGMITVDACRKKYYATAEDMAEYGWELYEAKDYLNSNTWFNDAVVEDSKWKDGYNGLGWTYAKLMVLDKSISNFETGLTKKQDDWNPTDIHSEILAGLTFAYHANKNDKKAIEYGRAFLDSTIKDFTPGWTFSHDSLLNYLDVRITMAAAYYATGKFDSTYTQLDVILDSIKLKDKSITQLPVEDTTLIGRKKMAEQIMFLQDYLLAR